MRSGNDARSLDISHARENLFPLVRQVNGDHVVIEIVARNGGNAVLMSAEDSESLQETLYLFSARANAVHILRGLAEVREGAAQLTELGATVVRQQIRDTLGPYAAVRAHQVTGALLPKSPDARGPFVRSQRGD